MPNDHQHSVWTGNLDSELSSCWEDFVNCKKRLMSEEPFLLEILQNYVNPYIFDAAMGIGCETMMIADKGYRIIGNEIKPELRELAIGRFRSKNLKIQVTPYDWRYLYKEFVKSEFDVILLLGNSLCLQREFRDRIKTAENLRYLCADGGTLVIDERNFRYILENRDEILNGHFRYKYKVMYCGDRIKACPISIEDDCVRFKYQGNPDNKIYGYLDMHPFRRGEIIDLFFEVGFKHVDIYSDLKLGYFKGADFYTYVFK